MQLGQTYSIQLSGLTDCTGNVEETMAIRVGLPRSPNRFDLLVTEIFADPDPAVGLPEFEWIELKNNSEQLLTTSGMTVQFNHDLLKLPAMLLQPTEYVILTSTAGTAAMQVFGRVIGLPNWLGLNNDGEQLILRNHEGEVIFETTYTEANYRDQEKQNGGWSLEMLDESNPCGGSENWAASIHPTGGTPGKANSQALDITDHVPPVLLEAIAEDSTRILLIFNEKIDSLSGQLAQFGLVPALPIKHIIFSYANPKELRIELTEPLVRNRPYQLTINNLQDCAGNTSGGALRANILLPSVGELGDVLLSEVLFNPVPGAVDFVELYNPSERHVDLRQWQIGNPQSSSGDPRPITKERKILKAKQFAVLTPDLSAFKTAFPTVPDSVLVQSALPSLNDDAGTVEIWHPSGQSAQRFNYDEKMHFPLLRDVEGVSLERLDYEISEQVLANWHSAAASVGYATPGKRNSQQVDFQGIEDCITIEPPIIFPDQAGGDNFAVIRLGCQRSGTVGTVSIWDVHGQKVRTLARQEVLSADGFWQWDGTDDSGQRVNMGYYLVLFELFDLDGNIRSVKKKIAVGVR